MLNKLFVKRETQFNLGISLVLLGLFFFMLSKGAILAPDSMGYFEGTIYRSPGYPLFIKFVQLFSVKHNHFLLVAIQLAMGFIATLSLAKCLQTILQFNKIFFVLFTFILLTPYFGFTGNYILTEGLAYPFFLFSTRWLCLGLMQKNNVLLCSFILSIAALVLVRGQFWFMYVLGFFAILYAISYTGGLGRKTALFGTLLFSLFLSLFLDKIYHYYYHKDFTSTPFTGVHLLMMPLYISDIEDLDVFKTSTERAIFSKVKKSMEEKKLSHLYTSGNVDLPYHFYSSYDTILYQTLYPILATEASGKTPSEIDGLFKNMAFALIKNRPIVWLKMYARNVASHLGGYYGSLVMFCLLILSSLAHICYRDKLSLLGCIISLMAIGNAAFVSIVQAHHVRYLFYSEVLLACFLISIIYAGLNRNNNTILIPRT